MSLLQEIKAMVEHFRDHGHAHDLPEPITALAHRLAEAIDNVQPGGAGGISLAEVQNHIESTLESKVGPFLEELRQLVEGRLKELEDKVAGLMQPVELPPPQTGAEQSQGEGAQSA